MARLTSAYPVEPLFDSREASLDHGLKFAVGENVGPVVLDALPHQFAHIGWIDAARHALLYHLEWFRARIAANLSVGILPKRSGRFRDESMIWVRTNPGHSTDTPIPRGANSLRKPSERATTPYLDTLY